MPKRRKVSPSPYAGNGADLGPSVGRASDGRIRNWGGAADIVVEDRPDPNHTDRTQLVRGARRRTAIGDLYGKGSITKQMHDAVGQFLDDCSIASGGTAASDFSGAPSTPTSRAGLPERQVSAITRVRMVYHLLGLNSGCVFWWVVFDNQPLRAWEKSQRLRNGTGASLLRLALDALDGHYNPVCGPARQITA